MDFAAFEHDAKFVIEALRRGEIDYLENLSEAAEADFFRHLIDRDALTRLAEHYPTPRKKEEVPVWLYIASQIGRKLRNARGTRVTACPDAVRAFRVRPFGVQPGGAAAVAILEAVRLGRPFHR